MNIFRLVTSIAGGSKSGSNLNHQMAPELKAGFSDMIKAVARKRIEAHKAQAWAEKGTKQVLEMDDCMLKDIGLTQSDRNSLKAGLTSLEELNAQRKTYYNPFK